MTTMMEPGMSTEALVLLLNGDDLATTRIFTSQGGGSREGGTTTVL